MQVNSIFPVKLLYPCLLLPFLFAGLDILRPLQSYECIRVLDGDTVILQKNDRQLRIRMANIDAPESSQLSLDNHPVGKWSKDFLSQKILGQKVELQKEFMDMYGRWVGVIYLEGKNINLTMVEMGMAVIYPKRTTVIYRAMMSKAKLRHVGIWKTEGIESPSTYRKRMKK